MQDYEVGAGTESNAEGETMPFAYREEEGEGGSVTRGVIFSWEDCFICCKCIFKLDLALCPYLRLKFLLSCVNLFQNLSLYRMLQNSHTIILHLRAFFRLKFF